MTYDGTRLETEEEVQQALERYRGVRRKPPVAPPVPAPLPAVAAPADDSPPPFRPTRRPPMALITVFDDGEETGEMHRVRQEQFVIGRTEGDLVIPHDSQMSGRHAELRRSLHRDRYRWHLADLKSTNGTYVRVGHAVLRPGQEFLLGRSRFRFEHEGAPVISVKESTRLWTGGSDPQVFPQIVELLSDGPGARVAITSSELWLGRDAAHCQVVLRDDPFASARHARIRVDSQGQWLIENNKSVNGVWLRIDRIALKGTCHALLGEQQLMIRIPG